MCLFRRKREKFDITNIISVVVLEKTQYYTDRRNWGLSYGSSWDDSRVFSMKETVPAGMEILFSVTYKDGNKETIKAKSGTEKCEKLLQLALDPPIDEMDESYPNEIFSTESNTEKPIVSVGKNELPPGDYVIGKDIPPGTYDFTWVWGQGAILKFKNEHDTTLGGTTYFQHVGNKEEHESIQCLNVKCIDGELLVISGNVIVKISRSKTIDIDL